jgi:large subunit ribosomal protein L15
MCHPLAPGLDTPYTPPVAKWPDSQKQEKPRLSCHASGTIPARRSEMKLTDLRDNPGATKARKRVGRGPGSGTGKMGGRGIKGQKSRSGVAIKGYEGGQMPLYQRLPKRGFNKPNRKSYAVVNLAIIEKFVAAGKLDASAPITEDVLVAAGVVRRKLDGVRVLAKTAYAEENGVMVPQGFKTKIDLDVTGASKAAVEMVEAAGGSLKVAAAAAE